MARGLNAFQRRAGSAVRLEAEDPRHADTRVGPDEGERFRTWSACRRALVWAARGARESLGAHALLCITAPAGQPPQSLTSWHGTA